MTIRHQKPFTRAFCLLAVASGVVDTATQCVPVVAMAASTSRRIRLVLALLNALTSGRVDERPSHIHLLLPRGVRHHRNSPLIGREAMIASCRFFGSLFHRRSRSCFVPQHRVVVQTLICFFTGDRRRELVVRNQILNFSLAIVFSFAYLHPA